MEEVLSIYTQPYDAERPVVCLDESSKQLIGEVRKPLPAEAGHPERFDSEYSRKGVANLFIAFEPLAGQRLLEVTDQRTRVDFAHFVKKLVDEYYPTAKTIVLVMDNLNTHDKTSLYEAFEPVEAKRLADKLEIHYTPKHGSWLNMAEIEFSHLSRQCLDRRIESREILQQEVTAWMISRNQQKASMTWRFTVEDARIKLKRLYPLV
jgi:transposase